MQQIWPAIAVEELQQRPDLHEAGVLRLDCSKTRAHLGWRPVWRSSGVIEKTVCWYREFYESNRLISNEQLEEYITDAAGINHLWISG
jgi:CDP-glucose 4,6-dehydratase